ncbi:MAG: hypothetical protein A2Y24_06625 [Clostridiales bacterium GWE2_32_10]|nr:MAG: hypothetical protein A2Y24_06625 [Clostridiales bacterium GWE2_32_10]HBY20405.1 hypothetical protein [Clostridiales bacterium]
MKTLEEFRDYFETQIVQSIEPLENQRIKVLKKTTVVLVVMVIIPIAILVFGNQELLRVDGEPLLQLTFFYVAICGAILYWMKKSYVSDFKDKIIEKIVGFFDDSFIYKKNSCISDNIFNCCEIFDTTPNKYSGDDYVSGVIVDQEYLDKLGQKKGTKIEFSEIKAEKESGTGKHRTVHTIFKGLFFMADYNKNFSGITRVLPDYKKRWLFAGKDRVMLEDPEFERLFEVYSTDQIEARYILTPSLMDRLKSFKQKTGRPVYASFVNNKIYVAIEYARNLFEPDIFKTLYDFAPMQQYFEDLQFAISIVEELNLNTRIWSKS